jgi:transcription termination factor Rho
MRPAMDAGSAMRGRIPVTDTTEIAATSTPVGSTSGDAGRRTGSLSALRLPQLQALASELGLSGTGKMRKSDLVEAITARQSGGSAPRRAGSPAKAPSSTSGTSGMEAPSANGAGTTHASQGAPATRAAQPAQQSTDGPEAHVATANRSADQPAETSADQAATSGGDQGAGQRREPRQRNRQGGQSSQASNGAQSSQGNQANQANQGNQAGEGRQQGGSTEGRQQSDRQGGRQGQSDRQGGQGNQGQSDRQGGQGNQGQSDRQGSQGNQSNQNNQNNGPRRDDDDGDGSRRGRRNRYRDRKRRGTGQGGGDLPGQYDEPDFTEDDIVVPVAGILDVLDSYAFIRTSGYLPGSNDVYVSLGQVKKNGLRKGDAVTGAVRAPHEGEQPNQRAKFNALVRLDTVNGMTPEQAKARVEFSKLTPLYPQERLRLETEPGILTTRIIDLVAPIGKGQRGLIVSPAKAGKTLILQAIANSISVNNPECHLMVVLVDERPEEVTDMQRAIKGEVIASTFDRPADDHTTVAELAIERAKRLVELGHDVVVLLDSITRLGRAYNLAAPASGRILSGGVDSSALYPPKRFFGAARNVENGGSLTIIATALIDTGSKMDEVIFEEFKGTGNMELRLDRRLADKRLFPAVDVNPSGTRREEILLGREELAVSWKLRRVLTALDSQQALELMLDRLRKTSSNAEFLMQVQKTSPSVPGQSDDD